MLNQAFIAKGIIQISVQNFFENYPFSRYDSSPGLFGYAGCLGLAVEPKVWENIEIGGKKCEFGYETPGLSKVAIFPFLFRYAL